MPRPSGSSPGSRDPGSSRGRAANQGRGQSRGQSPSQSGSQSPSQSRSQSPSQSGGQGRRQGRRRRRRGYRSLRGVRETSAGGLVIDRLDEEARAALIGRVDRRGRLEWVLPKGHVEPGETPEEAAVREVREETGLHARVLEPLGEVDYWFIADDRRVHKTVRHFLLECTGGALSTEDPEVSEIAWVPLGDLPGRLRYASERRLLDRLPLPLRDAQSDTA